MQKILSSFFILLIKVYQRVVSPLTPISCRYNPTCSEYGIQAIKKHGLLKGCWFTLKRLSSCHPCGGSGYDPVP